MNCSKLSSHKFFSKLPLVPASPGAQKVISPAFLFVPTAMRCMNKIHLGITPFEDPAFLFQKRSYSNQHQNHPWSHPIYIQRSGHKWWPMMPLCPWCFSNNSGLHPSHLEETVAIFLDHNILGVRWEIHFSNTSLDHGDVKTYTAHVRLDL